MTYGESSGHGRGGNAGVAAKPNDATVSDCPLAAVENMVCDVSETFDGDGTCAAVAFLEGVPEEETMRKALSAVQWRHPKLRASIVHNAKGIRCWRVLDPVPPIPLVFQELDEDSEPWKDEFRHLLDNRFRLDVGPLARVLVATNRCSGCSRISYAAHHALVDGASMLCVLNDLLAFYAAYENQTEIPESPPRPLISNVRPIRIGTAWTRAKIVTRLLRQRIQTEQASWTRLPEPDSQPARQLFESHSFTLSESIALVRACRKEDTSLNGVLLAAAARGIQTALNRSRVRLKCRIAMDARQFLRDDDQELCFDDIGCFVGGVDRVYTLRDRDPFWALARRAHRDLWGFLQGGGLGVLHKSFRFARNITAVPAGMKRPSLQVSAGAVAAIPERYGSLRVSALMSGAKHDHVGPQVGIGGFVLHRRLQVSMSAAGVPSAFWASVWENTLGELRVAAARGEPIGPTDRQ